MARKHIIRILIVTAVAAGAVLLWLRGWREPELGQIIRLTPPREGQAGVLQVPIVRYARGSVLGGRETVDFVGAVHLGEPQYYAALNRRFAGYDAVLFELVGDPGQFAARLDSENRSVVGMIQVAMASLLGLQFQLNGIDYRAPNFVHADLTPGQLSDAMTARGETLPSLLLRLLRISFNPELKEKMRQAGFEEQRLDGINPIMIALRGPTEAERQKIKLVFAQGLASSDVFMKALQGEQGVALINDRNAAAVRVTEEQLRLGKKHLAIFYGVGHLPDLHERLTKGLGFEVVDIEWVDAWSL